MNLGEVIAYLEKKDPDQVALHGFHNPHSYRGYYSQLAFSPATNITAQDMLEAARGAVGKEYQGWKGGYHMMLAETPCWISHEGEVTEDLISVRLLDLMFAAETTQVAALEAEVADLKSAIGIVKQQRDKYHVESQYALAAVSREASLATHLTAERDDLFLRLQKVEEVMDTVTMPSSTRQRLRALTRPPGAFWGETDETP